MILPAGVTKGAGLTEALADMGLSRHNAIGVGDAENDYSLLDACEIGVAVANAVDAIRAHADVVLSSPDGQGVAELLRGPLLAGRGYVHPRRWQLVLGTDDLGQRVLLPASQLNLAICGGTGDGKSYLAGLILEQLVQLGYSLIVFDPEGDHRGLGKLHGVFVTGGQEDRLADPSRHSGPAAQRLLLRGRRRVPPRRGRPGQLLGPPGGRNRSSPRRDRPAAVGGHGRSPRAGRPDRGRAQHVQPGRQGLPAHHLEAR